MNAGVEIPKFFRVRQKFPRPRVQDFSDAVRKAIDRSQLSGRMKLGDQVAITAGSRGIANIAIILKQIVAEVKRLGGVPFLVQRWDRMVAGLPKGKLAC